VIQIGLEMEKQPEPELEQEEEGVKIISNTSNENVPGQQIMGIYSHWKNMMKLPSP